MKGSILLCYDGSDGARAAIEAARTLIEGSALVATVWEPMHADLLAAHAPALGPAVQQAVAELDQIAANGATRCAEEGCAVARENGFSAEPVALAGSYGVWAALVQLAEERDARVIVLGRRGQSPVSAALFGSVSTGVLHHAHCPVLAVPSNDSPRSTVA